LKGYISVQNLKYFGCKMDKIAILPREMGENFFKKDGQNTIDELVPAG
jgi:hypothetical protein